MPRHINWRYAPMTLVMGAAVWLGEGPVVAVVCLVAGLGLGLGLGLEARARRRERQSIEKGDR